jgi:hypothetical protein
MPDEDEPLRGMERLSLGAQNAQRRVDNDRRRVEEKKIEDELRPTLWKRIGRLLRR